MDKKLFNKINALQNRLFFRQPKQYPIFTRKIPSAQKLYAELSTEKVGMFSIAVTAIPLQRPQGIIS